MTFRLLFKTASLAIACFTIAVPSHATTVYKTVGDFGEVKYSQFPPSSDDVEVEIITLRNDGRQLDPGQLAESAQTANNTQSQSANPATETERQRYLTEIENAKRCQSLRDNLANLNAGGRIYEPDGQGGRKYLDNREIELKRENIQRILVQYCGG